MINIRDIQPEDTYPIRKAILREGMTLSPVMAGDRDNDTLHLGLFKSQNLVAIASFMRASTKHCKGAQYQLRGMAVSKAFQGMGYGKLILKRAEDILQQRGVEIVWCNARVVATEFYSKSGYEKVGEVFDVPQIGPHFVMFKNLEQISDSSEIVGQKSI